MAPGLITIAVVCIHLAYLTVYNNRRKLRLKYASYLILMIAVFVFCYSLKESSEDSGLSLLKTFIFFVKTENLVYIWLVFPLLLLVVYYVTKSTLRINKKYFFPLFCYIFYIFVLGSSFYFRHGVSVRHRYLLLSSGVAFVFLVDLSSLYLRSYARYALSILKVLVIVYLLYLLPASLRDMNDNWIYGRRGRTLMLDNITRAVTIARLHGEKACYEFLENKQKTENYFAISYPSARELASELTNEQTLKILGYDNARK